MINNTGKFDSKRSGHKGIVARKFTSGKRQDLTPFFLGGEDET
jgi:hypothetical protein